MSAEAPKIEATGAQTQPEQQQQDQTQQQQQPTEPQPTDTEPAAEPKPKTNPLKKVASIFKTLFGCLRKPAVREDGGDEKAKSRPATGDVTAEAAADEKTAPVDQADAAKEGDKGTTTTVVSAQPPTC